VSGLLTFAAAICVLLLVAADPVRASSILLTQTFTGTTAPGWVMMGSAATLTASTGTDPVGQGWLRLTNASGDESSFVYDNTAIPSGYGIDVTFKFATWGGTGADGFALVLFDGSVTPAAGAYGGSLGYAQNSTNPGLAGGFLAIGFDEYGNFTNPTEGRQGGPGLLPGAISIRGPGDGTSDATGPYGQPNYGFITTSGGLPAADLQLAENAIMRPSSPSDFRQVEIIADTSQISEGHLPVSVILKVGTADAPQTIIKNFDAYNQVLAYYGNDPSRIPQTLKFGFTGSTGGSTNNHEIQGLTVNSIENAPGYAQVVPEPPSLVLCGIAIIGLSLLLKRWSKHRIQG
jgi:hypothetical protein